MSEQMIGISACSPEGSPAKAPGFQEDRALRTLAAEA
jgi:hypothetical protein